MSFDISRLRRSDQIIAGGAIALFIFMFFFKWLGFSSSTPIGGVSVSSDGWNSFHNSRWIWLITIAVSLGVVALTAAQREIESPVQLSVLVAGLGALSTIFIIYRIIHHPSGSGSVALAGVNYSYGIKIGIWLGLIAAVAITYGGYLAMQDEGTSLSDVREQASGAFSGITSPAGGGSSPAGGSSTGEESSAGSAGGSSAPPAAPSTPPPTYTPPPPAPPIPPPAAPPGQESSGEAPPPAHDA